MRKLENHFDSVFPVACKVNGLQGAIDKGFLPNPKNEAIDMITIFKLYSSVLDSLLGSF